MKAFGIAGWSGSGKTTLIEKLIPELIRRGLRVSVIKHAHHGFDLDRPGKDTWRHREAGASEVMITSAGRWALMHEIRGGAEPTLADYLQRFSACDLVIVEGFKHEPIPKLEVHRPSVGKPLLYPETPHVVGVASDEAIESGGLPRLDLNDIAAIADFVVDCVEL